MLGFGETPLLPPTTPPDPNRLAHAPTEDLTHTLPDNRTLSYATYGSASPSAPTMFLFHGMPGSRLCGRNWDKLCQRLPARLIALDRPGCGLSTPGDRGLKEWPQDVLSLADHLGIERFSVVGASGGGPFALACARWIPRERLRGATVVCGIGPVEALLDTVPVLSWRFGGLTPWVLKLAARYVVLPSILAPYGTKDPSQLKRVLEDQCVTPEEKALIAPSGDSESWGSLDDSVAQFLEAFKQGSVGAMQDGTVLCRDWGFDLKEVDSGKVWLVHGDHDRTAPVEVARWMDERLGGGRLKVLEGKTHFTIWKDHSEEIFRQSAEA
ncbi:alpha/beta-hydrolase [Lentithecium fluviatile CBS 122367]|uniref:Alpha/beta-hydrolase n=1 Tax=Lentithecium fluviatile CBS 122367 TaxID=1168545 RepID=A0A6G1J3K8_9PLEO|nr:alpha/beta-hydrolase [Lentithecium fluviatile CBS 122367]